MFKLSINLSHKKDLNYINEFGPKADGGKLRPNQDRAQSNQVQFSVKTNSLYIFTVAKNNAQSESNQVNIFQSSSFKVAQNTVQENTKWKLSVEYCSSEQN